MLKQSPITQALNSASHAQFIIPLLNVLSYSASKAHSMYPKNSCITQEALVFSTSFRLEPFGSITRVSWVRPGLAVIHGWYPGCLHRRARTQKVIMCDINLGSFREPGRFFLSLLGTQSVTSGYLRITGTPGSMSQIPSTRAAVQWHQIQTFHPHWQTGLG